jgi:predicted ribosomally synthesized peptide with nif11-like leader
MTVDNARQFIEMLEHDTSLQTQYTISSPNTTEAVVDFASGKGYMFTKDDLVRALKGMPDSRVAQELRQRVR